MFFTRVLRVVAVWLLLLVGGEEGERDGTPVLALLHRVRDRQPRHPAPRRIHFHIKVNRIVLILDGCLE